MSRVIRLAIGLPTRNRPDMARAAIEAVLRWPHPDVVLVVSDNSTDPDALARLAEFCAGLPPEAVRYVRPPEPLAMAEHWAWLWHEIRDTLSPTHVGYLTDRLVLAARALPQLVGIVAREPELVLSFQVDHVHDLRTPVELVQRQWTGQLLELDARELIELSRRGRSGDFMPRMLNSITPAGVMSAIERRFGDVFGDVAPDYRFAFRALAVCDTTLYLDRSCVTEHGMTRSAGIGFSKGTMNQDASRFARELAVPRFGATPEPGFETVANAIFQEYCAVRQELGGDRFPPPHWRSYLTANAISVDRIQDPAWRERMRDLLRRRGYTRRNGVAHVAGLTLEMAGYFARHPGALARSVKRQLWDRPPGTPAAFLLARAGLSPRLRDDLRFASSAEALAHADLRPRRRMPYSWHLHRVERAGAIVRRLGTEPPASGYSRIPDGADGDHPHAEPERDHLRDADAAGGTGR